MIRAVRLSVMLLFAMLVCAPRGMADDAFTRWQDQEARNRMLDEEKQLISREAELKKDLFELDREILEKGRKRAFMTDDLHNLQREILSLKMRLM